MATAPTLGSISVRIDRVYGRVVVYPVCERARLLAQIAGTTTLTHQTLGLIRQLGLEIVETQGLTIAEQRVS